MVGHIFWLVSDPAGPLTDHADRTLDPVIVVGPVGTELGPTESAVGDPELPEYF